jgi:hypothetical protein
MSSPCCFSLRLSVYLLNFETILLIGIVGGGVELVPLSTAATNRPIVPAPDDYDDEEIGGIFGRGTEVLGENLSQCRFVHHKLYRLPGRETGPPQREASV